MNDLKYIYNLLTHLYILNIYIKLAGVQGLDYQHKMLSTMALRLGQ